MYKTLLDHRFAEEFEQLLTVRRAIAEDIAAAAPAPQSVRGLRLHGTGLEGLDSHPLTSTWLRFEQPRFCEPVVHAQDLPEELADRLQCYVIIANEHVANRTKAKRLLNDLESRLRMKAVHDVWPQAQHLLKAEPQQLLPELNDLLRL